MSDNDQKRISEQIHTLTVLLLILGVGVIMMLAIIAGRL